MKQVMLQLGKQIALSKNIILINHIRMDPDAFGSLAAFYYILKDQWYNVVAINDIMPDESFDFLGASDIFKTDLDIVDFKPDLIISFDASSLAQLWTQYTNYEDTFKNTPFYVVDHHKSNPGFGEYNIINADASSTCEIALHILETIWLDEYITPKIATLLTAGLHTDTNIYYNQNTSADTLRTWAKLMEYWADFRAPMFEFFKKKTYLQSKLWWEILTRLQQDGNIFYGVVTMDIFEKLDINPGNSSPMKWIINEFFANLEGMEVCFLIYPLSDTETKVSMRSKQLDVSKIASSHWWGGHHLAAGYQTNLSPQETADQLLTQLKKEL